MHTSRQLLARLPVAALLFGFLALTQLSLRATDYFPGYYNLGTTEGYITLGPAGAIGNWQVSASVSPLPPPGGAYLDIRNLDTMYEFMRFDLRAGEADQFIQVLIPAQTDGSVSFLSRAYLEYGGTAAWTNNGGATWHDFTNTVGEPIEALTSFGITEGVSFGFRVETDYVAITNYDKSSLVVQYLEVSAIPEPSTYAALAGAAALGLAMWRRRRGAPRTLAKGFQFTRGAQASVVLMMGVFTGFALLPSAHGQGFSFTEYGSVTGKADLDVRAAGTITSTYQGDSNTASLTATALPNILSVAGSGSAADYLGNNQNPLNVSARVTRSDILDFSSASLANGIGLTATYRLYFDETVELTGNASASLFFVGANNSYSKEFNSGYWNYRPSESTFPSAGYIDIAQDFTSGAGLLLGYEALLSANAQNRSHPMDSVGPGTFFASLEVTWGGLVDLIDRTTGGSLIDLPDLMITSASGFDYAAPASAIPEPSAYAALAGAAALGLAMWRKRRHANT